MRPLLNTLGVALALCLATPAFAACEKVAGKHGGRFNVDKREDAANSGRPDYVSGNWSLTIDAATCAITGEADSPLTGPVALTGTYGGEGADTSKFRIKDVYMDAAGNPDFIQFSFSSASSKRLLRYVVIETAAYLYVGDFDGK
ncbi:hypothetical protein ABAC460_06020 [Asticcacaulis sp. AC460]|uniref:hypothetical protein n=1 Tax=Asticcacaulis sp. AC460 TaxID=1282360 RepID=UPI0003C3CB5F|nr:hypothetical protein [Asticcacaulis sp. AC460]ESQ91539.1 hypothetical protein ABAC460_06020 [Asticcacaulis sp. AC460]